MPLIKSISGIRGTIGGQPGDTLSPVDVVKFTSAYGMMLLQNTENKKIVIGRDARMSGAMVSSLVSNSLVALGFDVIDLGLSTTPTVEMAVVFEKAAGGIILTASHNPKEWNALKLLNEKGEFISAEQGNQLLAIAADEAFTYATVDKLGSYQTNDTALQQHIDAILAYDLVDVAAIKKAKFKIIIDAINSSGAFAVPAMLKALGVKDVTVLNGDMHGNFAHNPEPLPQHLTELSNEVNRQQAHLGISVDPDVDRLCFVCEDGSMFGEEYTLVAVADYILQHRKGASVSNMSSTRALRDVAAKHGCEYYPSAVGEVNVVAKMKAHHAVIGGEGNGGIIVPDLHYGRDALIGIALFLSHLAKTKKTIKQLRNSYPDYMMAKKKIDLQQGIDVKAIFEKIKDKYKNQPINTEDGLKIEFDESWVHLRTSNTEPIIRIYTESNNETTADNIANRLIADIKEAM
jgi:phosphomannomutase